MEKRVYTIKEAQELIPVCRNTFVKQIESGKIKSFRIGRRIFIPADVINELLAGSSNGYQATSK